LIIHNENGRVVKDACCITYPGSHRDTWWDHAQLLTQVDKAILIFEEAHPDCIVLFVFDHLSAHALLTPDVLYAFDMNKLNGGKQRKQRDIVIPMNNPYPEFCGKPQKMMTESGEAKGLQQTLEEHGFNIKEMKLKTKCSPICAFENERCCMAHLLSRQDNFWSQKSQIKEIITGRGHLCIFLPKFHCKLNLIEMVCFDFILLILNSHSLQYWGWCKHWYREHYKETFANAKRVACECLDTCPVDVIRCFFNQSWKFMSAYWQGLTGKVAEWAVHQQKSHQHIGEQVMRSIDAVVKPN